MINRFSIETFSSIHQRIPRPASFAGKGPSNSILGVKDRNFCIQQLRSMANCNHGVYHVPIPVVFATTAVGFGSQQHAEVDP